MAVQRWAQARLAGSEKRPLRLLLEQSFAAWDCVDVQLALDRLMPEQVAAAKAALEPLPPPVPAPAPVDPARLPPGVTFDEASGTFSIAAPPPSEPRQQRFAETASVLG